MDFMENSIIIPIEKQIEVIGSTILQRRKLLRITQVQLADMCDVSSRYIYEIEKGKANPSLDTLLRILHVLGLEFSIGVRKVN